MRDNFCDDFSVLVAIQVVFTYEEICIFKAFGFAGHIKSWKGKSWSESYQNSGYFKWQQIATLSPFLLWQLQKVNKWPFLREIVDILKKNSSNSAFH